MAENLELLSHLSATSIAERATRKFGGLAMPAEQTGMRRDCRFFARPYYSRSKENDGISESERRLVKIIFTLPGMKNHGTRIARRVGVNRSLRSVMVPAFNQNQENPAAVSRALLSGRNPLTAPATPGQRNLTRCKMPICPDWPSCQTARIYAVS